MGRIFIDFLHFLTENNSTNIFVTEGGELTMAKKKKKAKKKKNKKRKAPKKKRKGCRC
ncbi:MAG: hypothetical protein KAI63_08580 [Planctomycetes bacterium]|nr:hypothetical protein [Planctomycetota bacterium]